MSSVLVVDDDQAIRRMLSEVLTLEGYTVQTAEHGGPALDMMRASRDRLVVILGLVMPHVNGQDGAAPVKIAPPSGPFAAVNVPPCARIMRWAMARPSPAPPVARLREASPR